MTGKEKLQKALNHEPGSVPVDFGSDAITGMHARIVAGLRDNYGLQNIPVKVIEPFNMLGEIDDERKPLIGVDVDGLYPYGSIFSFPNKDWKVWRTPWEQEVEVPGRFEVREVGGDAEGALDPKDNLEEFVPISHDELAYCCGQAERLKRNGRGLCTKFDGNGLGDIVLVLGPFLKEPKGIRDITEWYIFTSSRRDYLHAIFSRQTEQALENLAKIKDAVGNSMDAMFLCGIDFGTQTSTLCSIETFMEIFIDAGFDIINPVQCSAAGMEPETLKRKYGSQVVFWGGGVDT